MKDYKELEQFKDVPAEEFRKPMLITTYRKYYDRDLMCYSKYYECPRCQYPTEHNYQAFCDACGQRLRWDYSKMRLRK